MDSSSSSVRWRDGLNAAVAKLQEALAVEQLQAVKPYEAHPSLNTWIVKLGPSTPVADVHTLPCLTHLL
jgi:hypothetical protein